MKGQHNMFGIIIAAALSTPPVVLTLPGTEIPNYVIAYAGCDAIPLAAMPTKATKWGDEAYDQHDQWGYIAERLFARGVIDFVLVPDDIDQSFAGWVTYQASANDVPTHYESCVDYLALEELCHPDRDGPEVPRPPVSRQDG